MGLTCCKESSNNICNKITKTKEETVEERIESEYIPKDIDLKQVEFFLPDVNKGRVMKIYDGDTITIVCKPKNTVGKFYKYNVRLSGIDCPEISAKCEEEKKVAKIARDKVGLLLFKNMVEIENVKPDKYANRIVADVIYNDINVSEWLLEKKLAVPYDGGKKNPPDNWASYYSKKTD